MRERLSDDRRARGTVAAAGVAALLLACAACGGTPSPREAARDVASSPLRPAADGPVARSLEVRMGGPAAVTAFADALLSRAAADPLLAPRFAGANLAKFRKGLVDMVGQAAGGAEVYRGAPLRRGHAGMGLTDEEYEAWLVHVEGALAATVPGAGERSEVLDIFRRWRADVVQRRPGVEERLARVENRLASIDQRLQELLERIDAKAKPRVPSSSAEEEAAARPPEPRPPALPDAAKVNPLFKGEKWLPQEKDASLSLQRRYGEGHGGDGGEPREDLVGVRLPRTRFLSASGDVVDLREFEGKRKVALVVLRGFAGSICLHCSNQTIALNGAADRFRAAGVEPLLVYPGHADSVPAFLNATRVLAQGFAPRIAILLDVDLSLVRALRIEGGLARPSSMIIDEAGIVRYAYVGRQPADRPSASDLLAVVERLGER